MKELDLPLRFNQAVVMKHFSRMREDRRYFCQKLLADGKKNERLILLTSVCLKIPNLHELPIPIVYTLLSQPAEDR